MATTTSAAPAVNPLNPFAGAEPTGPSTRLKAPGWQRFEYDWQQSQQQQAQQEAAAAAHLRGMQALGLSGGYQVAQFAGQMAGAYTSAVTSGQPQPMAFGAAYGGLGGFAAGAAIGFMAGGPIGAAAGGLIGASVGAPIVNALQARSVANMQIAESLMPMAAQNGLDPMSLTGEANRIAKHYSFVKWNQSNFEDQIARNTGMYTGTDQASGQDAAAVMASLSGGYLQSGVDPNGQNIGGQATALINRYGGKGAVAIASAQGRVQAAITAAGGNLTDMMMRVGLPDMLSVFNRPGERAPLIAANNAIQTAGYNTGIASSVSDAGRTAYDASLFAGGSTRQRSGGFDAMIGGMQAQVNAIGSELSAIESGPGGKDSALAATKRALLSAAKAQIEAEYGKRAQGIVSDIQAGAGVAIAGANAGLSAANLYGGAGDFAAPTAALQSALTSEAQGLTSALGQRGLTYQDSMRIRARITEIGQQIQALPAQQAASEFGRRSLTGNVLAAGQSVVTTQAGLYGDNAAVESAARGAYDVQRSIYNDAMLTVNNPNASVETRGAAWMRADSASVSALQIQAGTRQTIINRIVASAGANQAELNVNLTKAQFGSGADMRMAGAGMVAALASEQGKLNEQLTAPGVTVEQKLALRSQIAGLESQQITLTESARDSGFQKDWISGYGLQATRLQGQAARQELLPFSPGSMMRTSLQMLQNNEAGLKMLSNREADLRKAGTLSPERQQEIETQRQALLTADAQQVAFLGQDLPNRLPAMMAGRASFSGRTNSFELAAKAVSGSANRSFGAANGDQLREQDAFTSPFIANDAIAPRSRTQAMNNGGDLNTALLERIARALEAGAGGAKSGMRPGEGTGAVASAVYGKRANLDNGRGY